MVKHEKSGSTPEDDWLDRLLVADAQLETEKHQRDFIMDSVFRMIEATEVKETPRQFKSIMQYFEMVCFAVLMVLLTWSSTQLPIQLQNPTWGGTQLLGVSVCLVTSVLLLIYLSFELVQLPLNEVWG